MLTQSAINIESRTGNSRNIKIRPQKSIKNDVSPINNKSAIKEKDEDEEELEVQTISKGFFDSEEELDFKSLLEALKEKSPVKPVKGKNIRITHTSAVAKKAKVEPDNRKADATSVIAKLKDVKALIEEVNRYQPKNSELDMTELKASFRMKVKRYRDCVYFGEMVSSKRQGKGVMIYADHRSYEGEWDNDLKHGKGLEILPNGNKYNGQFVHGEPEGHGTFHWANGETYEGQWKKGLRHGKGTWQVPKGECYDGDWNEGKADGFGVHTWKNGDKYEGDHKGFLKHGRGTETFSNGDSYRGNYINGKPDGYGEYKWANGCLYKGQFKNGLRHGKGLWQKGGNNSDSYDGEWVNDKKCGQGTYRWTSGNYYRGEYFEDMRHGYGEMCWTDGSYYKGQWENGIEQGEGELMVPNKAHLKGRFQNNQFVQSSYGDLEEDEDEDVETPSARRNVNAHTAREPHTAGAVETEGFPDIRKISGKPSERSHSQAASKKSLVPASTGNVDKNLKKRDSTLGKKAAPNNLSNLKTSSEPELPDFEDLKAGEAYNQVKKITYPQKTWNDVQRQAEGSVRDAKTAGPMSTRASNAIKQL